MQTAKITVLMPVYNTAPYLKEAIESILSQTFGDFEFLIIDDASTDGSVGIVKSYSDPRIKLIEKPRNTGYTNSLNMGLELARGEYIARMDSDDISLPARFAKQVAFMEAHPEVGACGTWVQTMGAFEQLWKKAEHDWEIKIKLFTETHLCHPSVMIRRSVLTRHQLRYDPAFEPAEDYDMWSNISKVSCLANLPEALLHYRVHQSQVSGVRLREQMEMVKRLNFKQLEKIGLGNATEEEKETHWRLFHNDYTLTVPFVQKAERWIRKLIAANATAGYIPDQHLEAFLRDRWCNITLGSTSLGLALWRLFVTSELSAYRSYGSAFKVKFFIKALLRA